MPKNTRRDAVEGIPTWTILDAGRELKVKLGKGGVDLKKRRKRFRKVDEEGDDDMFKCNCGSARNDRIHVLKERRPPRTNENERRI